MEKENKVNTVKLINNQFNLVHYYQYYDFETLGDIKNDLERKYKDFLIKVRKINDEFSVQFEKHKDMSTKLSAIQHNFQLHYTFTFDDKKNDSNTNNNQKKHITK